MARALRKDNVIQLPRPRTFTEAEQIIEYLSDRILSDSRGYKHIAEAIGRSPTTIQRVASRQTRWPRPETIFPLLRYFKVKFTIQG